MRLMTWQALSASPYPGRPATGTPAAAPFATAAAPAAPAAAVASPRTRGLHSSTFSAHLKHFLWDTLGNFRDSVTQMAHVELIRGV